jgi:uncharacterized membrane protein YgcG
MSTSASRRTGARLLVFLAFVLTAAAPLRAEFFVIKDYAVSVRLGRDGALEFDEIIEVEFTEQRHGIFRVIPLVDRVNGKRRELIIEDVTVEGWRFERNRDNNNLVIKIGDADRYVDGRQTYRVRYRVVNGLNFFDEHTELYWDLLGISWEVPVEQFRFTIDLPPGIEVGGKDVRLFSGSSGQTTAGDARVELVDAGDHVRIRGATNRVFQPGEAVTLAVRLPKGAFAEPAAGAHWLRLHGILLLPAALLAFVLALIVRARNRRQTIVVEFQPPTGISPAVAGGFIDHEVDSHDVLALIPLLAYKKYLRLEIEEKKHLLVFTSRDVQFVQLKPADDALPPFERHFLTALFAYGPVVDLDSLKNRFYRDLATIRAGVKSWIDDQEWYEPDQQRNRWLVSGAGFVSIIAGGLALSQEVPDGVFVLGTGFVILFLSRFFRRRNQAGNELYKKLEGFRRFVVKAERPVLERLVREDPEYFDKTLPYAVAFGEVKRWTRQFEGLLAAPPAWYHSHHGLSGNGWSNFSEHFSSEMNTIDSVFSSSPSSSSGGGGSSGGGSGGGGGGSW